MGKTQIPLDSSPEHANALGRMLGHWAIIEHNLSSLLGALLGIEQSREQMLFNTFISISSKIELIERLIHSYVIESKEKEMLISLVEKAATYNTERNSYVHSTWAAGTEGNLTKLDSRVPNNKKKRYRPAQEIAASTIEEFVSNLSELSNEFTQFMFKGFPKIQISVQPIE